MIRAADLLTVDAALKALALAVGRQWNRGSSMSQQDYSLLHKLNALGAAVTAFDALQPKG